MEESSHSLKVTVGTLPPCSSVLCTQYHVLHCVFCCMPADLNQKGEQARYRKKREIRSRDTTMRSNDVSYIRNVAGLHRTFEQWLSGQQSVLRSDYLPLKYFSPFFLFSLLFPSCPRRSHPRLSCIVITFHMHSRNATGHRSSRHTDSSGSRMREM